MRLQGLSNHPEILVIVFSNTLNCIRVNRKFVNAVDRVIVEILDLCIGTAGELQPIASYQYQLPIASCLSSC